MTKEQFQKSAWYRLLQVIFFGLFLIATILTIVIFITNKPHRYLDDSKSSVVCISGPNQGKFYPLNKNGFYTYTWSEDLSTANQIDARKLCAYDKINITYDRLFPDPVVDNYRLSKIFIIENSWGQAFGYSILYVASMILVFWFIKRLFFFIFFGDNIFEKPKKLFD